ncbi:MAG: hypothetical protein IKR74_01965 [Bacilli bacterium]|nr:hypothetical protein [Bacilli bacterium]
MKKRIIILLIILLIIILGIVIALGKGKIINTNKEKFPDVVIVPDLELKYRLVDNCMSADNCDIKESIYYRLTDYSKNPDLEDIIRKINSNYTNRISNLEEGKYSFDECPEKASIYKYRYVDKGYMYYFVNDTLAAVTLDLIAKDVCTEKTITPSFEVYYYDVKRQKVVDEEAFLKLLNIKKSDTDKKIIDFLTKKKIIKDEIDYNNMIVGNRIRCYTYVDMYGDLAAKCIYLEDKSYDDFLLYGHSEIGLEVKIPE